jgi:hypothetical protein
MDHGIGLAGHHLKVAGDPVLDAYIPPEQEGKNLAMKVPEAARESIV